MCYLSVRSTCFCTSLLSVLNATLVSVGDTIDIRGKRGYSCVCSDLLEALALSENLTAHYANSRVCTM